MTDDNHAIGIIIFWIYLRHLTLYILRNIGGVCRAFSGRTTRMVRCSALLSLLLYLFYKGKSIHLGQGAFLSPLFVKKCTSPTIWILWKSLFTTPTKYYALKFKNTMRLTYYFSILFLKFYILFLKFSISVLNPSLTGKIIFHKFSGYFV